MGVPESTGAKTKGLFHVGQGFGEHPGPRAMGDVPHRVAWDSRLASDGSFCAGRVQERFTVIS